MRQLKRPNPYIPTLAHVAAKHGEAWKAKLTRGPTGAHWNKPDVRGALFAMHGRVCAYCQSELRRGDKGDVDHFRPRYHYPWLAYDFGNFLMSCLDCNRNLKRAQFPLRDGSVRCTYATRDTLAQEPRLLLDPALDEIEAWVTYDVTHELCPMVVVADLPAPIAEMVETTLRILEVNIAPGSVRRNDLVQDRIRVMRETADCLDELENGAFDLAPMLAQLACRYFPHGMVARRVLEAARRHDLLPTPDEELTMFLNKLNGDLKDPLRLIAVADRISPASRHLVDELLFALGTLWVDPPAMDSERIGRLLDAFDLVEWVAPYRDQLTPKRGPV